MRDYLIGEAIWKCNNTDNSFAQMVKRFRLASLDFVVVSRELRKSKFCSQSNLKASFTRSLLSIAGSEFEGSRNKLS